MEQTITVDGQSYVIRHLKAREKYAILKEKEVFESNCLAVKYSLVSPQLSDEQIAEMDGRYFDFLNYKIAEFNSIEPFLEKRSPDTSAAEKAG